MIINGKTRTLEKSDIKDLLSKIPFYLEDFIDVSVDKGTYIKKVSPLFAEDYIESEGQVSTAITAAITAAPLGHIENELLETTRDPANINTPGALRSEFWKSLFRDAEGSEENNLITRVYNLLRHPILAEEQVLYSSVFKRFLSEEGETLAAFDTNTDDSDEVISKKLLSTYALLNYTPSHSSFISSWVEGLYVSGALDYDSMVLEENLYRIQDIKNELLRRKFAGSSTLYEIVASSINKRSSYVPVVPLKSVMTGSSFTDDRAIRALDLPGITTVASDVIVDPVEVFPSIPVNTIIPLYYTSENYSSERFAADRTQFLRNRSTSLSWDNIKGVLDASLVKKTYPRLDTYDSNITDQDLIDMEWPLDDEGNPIPPDKRIRLDTHYGLTDSFLALDNAVPMFDLSTITSGFFDIQADRVLFHENTLQKKDPVNYEFTTYTISGDASLSLMDIPWLSFVESSISAKKKVQENLSVGVQVSSFIDTPRSQVTENFTIITFSSEFTANFSEQDSIIDNLTHRYAYLWSVNIHYNRNTFVVERVSMSLITYMFFKVNESDLSAQAREDFSSHPSYYDLTRTTTGVIPYTYSDLTSSMLQKMIINLTSDEIRDDVYEEGYNKAYFLFTPYENAAIGKEYMRSPAEVLVNSGNWFHKPNSDFGLKHVIYGTKRKNKDSGLDEWFWSSPLRLYNKDLTNIKEYRPDWMDMVVYVNPYLNFREQCASPIRGFAVNTRALRPAVAGLFSNPEDPITGLIGPGPNAALSNLNYSHRMWVYVNNDGTNTNTNYPRGSYLRKVRPEVVDELTERLEIWGDNRPTDSAYTSDPMDDWTNDKVRNRIYRDSNSVECLKLVPGAAHVDGEADDSYFTIAPENSDVKNSSWKDWYWNQLGTSGLTFCFDGSMAIENEDPSKTVLTQNLYYGCRKGDVSATVPYAEFEAYYDVETDENNPRIVFSVFPTGFEDSTTLTTTLAAKYVDNGVEVTPFHGSQTQISFSYYVVEDTADPNKLNIEMSIVGDRLHTVRRWVTERSGDDYLLYADVPEDFSTEGLTPQTVVLPATYDYYLGNTDFKFGQLIKNGPGMPENNLGAIALANNYIDSFGYNSYSGMIFDVRLYNRGATYEELLTLNAGTRHELYSYSPALFRLAYQKANDLGVLKRFNATAPENEIPGSIRIFKRSQWDSILTDLYAQSEGEMDFNDVRYDPTFQDTTTDPDVYVFEEGSWDYAPGVIEQILVENYESMADISVADDIDFYYKGTKRILQSSDRYSLIQTTIYPHRYDAVLFDSSGVLAPEESSPVNNLLHYKAYWNIDDSIVPTGANAITFPVSPSGDTLEYQGIFDLDFQINDTINASSPISVGTNIAIDYDKDLQSFVSQLKKPTATASSAGNYLSYPLYIPWQGAYESDFTWTEFLSGINLTGLKMSSQLSKLMDVTSYYNELQVPMAYRDSTSPIGYSYTSRWTGMRALREGEYIFTFKFPIGITPLDNHEANLRPRPVIYYATTRIKVVAKGTPVYYQESPVKAYKEEWDPYSSKFSIAKTFKPLDNRTFPHRRIDLDMYVQYNAGTELSPLWMWKRIAANHDADPGVELINAPKASLPLPTSSLPMFLSKNYTAPFFVSGHTTDFVNVTVKNSGSLENLLYKSAADLDDIVLLSNRSYKLLIELSSSTPEAVYSSNIFTEYVPDQLENLFDYTQDEIDNYRFNVDLTKNSVTRNDALYNRYIPWNLVYPNVRFDNYRTGFAVNSSNAWEAVGDQSLGNPYSELSSENRYLSDLSNFRFDIYDLAAFPYRQEFTGTNTPIASARPYGSVGPGLNIVAKTLPLITRQGKGFTITSYPLDESKAVSSAADGFIVSGQGTLTNILSGAAITSLVTINPMSSYIKYQKVTPSSHTLVAYSNKSRNIPLSMGMYSQGYKRPVGNLILSQDFSDKTYYSSVPDEQYVYDSDVNAEVFSFTPDDVSSVTLTYNKDIGSSNIYTVSVEVKSLLAFNIQLKLIPYLSKTTKSIYSSLVVTAQAQKLASLGYSSAVSEVPADTWTTLTWTTDREVDPATIALIFSAVTGDFDAQSILIRNFRVQGVSTYKHLIGFSEATKGLANSSTSLPVTGAGLVSFMHSTAMTVFPLQFYCRKNDSGLLTATGSQLAADFISSYSLLPLFVASNAVSDATTLLRPWTRMISFKEADPTNVKVYKRVKTTDPSGAVVSRWAKTQTSRDVFNVNNSFQDAVRRSIRFNAQKNALVIGGDIGIELDLSIAQKLCNANISINTLTLKPTEERFTMINGCVNPDKFLRKEESVVGITNVQILNNESEDNGGTAAILYELEYLPIIYDETKNHISFNLLIKSQ